MVPLPGRLGTTSSLSSFSVSLRRLAPLSRRTRRLCASAPGPVSDEEDLYDVLGATPADTTDELRTRFRDLQRRLHPDVAGSSPAAVLASAKVNVAFATLSDPLARAAYDRTLKLSQPRRTARKGAPEKRNAMVGPMLTAEVLALTLEMRRPTSLAMLTGDELRDMIREWAKTLAYSSELPLPLPLQVDELPDGVRIAMLQQGPSGRLEALGELVIGITETEECDVTGVERTCDWLATVARRWTAGNPPGKLPGEERIMAALKREFRHLLAGPASSASFQLPSWLGALLPPGLPILGASRGGEYSSYSLARSCRLSADGTRPPQPVDRG